MKIQDEMTYTLEINSRDFECSLGFTWYEGDPGKAVGPPNLCYPPEPDEFEFYDLIYTDPAGQKHDLSFLIDTLSEDMETEAYKHMNQDPLIPIR